MNYTIAQMKKVQKENEHFWFSKGAMDYFNTKVETAAKKNYFITSDFKDEGDKKLYSIRKFDPITFKVSTVSEFQEFHTLELAKLALKELLMN